MIPPGTSIGKVRLRVADIDALSEFYERVVGLRGVEREGDLVRLGPEDGEPLVELVAAPRADPPPSFSTGLFHLAILVPDRAELARSLRRVIEQGWRLTGASDHLVSEALYLRDPEGNGIEIYRDRPRDQWGHADNGELRMATLPLDLDNVMAEEGASDGPPNGMPAGTTMGHVHLRVADIPASEAFYNGSLGLDVMVRSYPGRAVRGGRRLPPPHRPQHLGEPGRAGAAGGVARTRPLGARAAGRGRARRRGGARGRDRRPGAHRRRRAGQGPGRQPRAADGPRLAAGAGSSGAAALRWRARRRRARRP